MIVEPARSKHALIAEALSPSAPPLATRRSKRFETLANSVHPPPSRYCVVRLTSANPPTLPAPKYATPSARWALFSLPRTNWLE